MNGGLSSYWALPEIDHFLVWGPIALHAVLVGAVGAPWHVHHTLLCFSLACGVTLTVSLLA